ncbi:MAG: translation elongation factor Ts [Acidobacteria bacterium]|nr:translation elongation factor Ts [Acidobacteriota bacterium]
MAEITAQLVKQLRERTGAGMMECKTALVEANGILDDAVVILRKKGIASAAKKASRATKQGVISAYIHPGSQLGVLIEVNCESDFVARTEGFQDLVKDIAMQVAAADPRFIRREDVTPEILQQEKEIQKARAIAEGKPPAMADKIVEGRMNKFYEEVCLLEQPFIKENTLTVGQLIASRIATIKENITVARFVRFKVGETLATASEDGQPAQA